MLSAAFQHFPAVVDKRAAMFQLNDHGWCSLHARIHKQAVNPLPRGLVDVEWTNIAYMQIFAVGMTCEQTPGVSVGERPS